MAVPGKGLGKKLWSAAEMAALLGPGILLLAVRYARERDRWTPRAVSYTHLTLPTNREV